VGALTISGEEFEPYLNGSEAGFWKVLIHRQRRAAKLAAYMIKATVNILIIIVGEEPWCFGQLEASFHGWVVSNNRKGRGLHCTTD